MSYNTNLQGLDGIPQDLVDWLSPTLRVSTFLSQERQADIIVVGFQELLPLHLGLSGLSKSVIDNRDAHILSQIEANAPEKEPYSLIAKIVNGGVALLVYARDSGIARKVCDVQTNWTGCGPMYMGNKGAVGVRFRVPAEDGGIGETFTFVCAHLNAHDYNLARRIQDWRHIVGTLLFSPLPNSSSKAPSTIYSTSHLFFFGDLNFRVVLPPSHPLHDLTKSPEFADALSEASTRENLKDFDQLHVEKQKGTIFVGLTEGEFWNFKCSYKYKLGEVDKYSGKRTPSWTDRIFYATYTDSPDTPDQSNIINVLYTSIPSYTTSDHKPIVSLLLLPPSPAPPSPSTSTSTFTSLTPPTIRLPSSYHPTPDPLATFKRYLGRSLDRVIGIIWWLFTMMGAGSAALGIFNFFLGIAYSWWRSSVREARNAGSRV